VECLGPRERWKSSDSYCLITQRKHLASPWTTLIRHHHHHEQAPSWSVAVSTTCFQCSRSWVYFHAELRPRLRGWRSASRVRSQVWRGRPGGRLQSLGNPLMETLSALVMSSGVSILATCPLIQHHSNTDMLLHCNRYASRSIMFLSYWNI